MHAQHGGAALRRALCNVEPQKCGGGVVRGVQLLGVLLAGDASMPRRRADTAEELVARGAVDARLGGAGGGGIQQRHASAAFSRAARGKACSSRMMLFERLQLRA
jgi:hypothetical protein